MDATNDELIQRIVELEEKLAVYEKKEVSIYGLVDPRDGVIKYVGQSVIFL